jgi:uncharacterized membrane protein YbhN (UPF0104 family)
MSRRWLSTIIGLLALVLAVLYLAQQRDSLIAASSGLNWVALLPMFLLVLAMLAVNGLSLALFTRYFGVNLKVLEWFGIAVATSFANYVAPFSAGLVARAGYLKSRHALPYNRFLVLTAAQYLIAICLSTLVGFGLTIYVRSVLPPSGFALMAFFALTALGMIAFMIIPFEPIWFKKLPLGEAVIKALEGWQVIKRNFGLLSANALLVLGGLISNALLLYFAFKALGVRVTLTQAVLIGIILSLSIIIRITPGNLGLQEMLLGFVSPLTGIPLEAGLAAALVVRGVVIATVFSLGLPAGYLLARQAERSPAE